MSSQQRQGSRGMRWQAIDAMRMETIDNSKIVGAVQRTVLDRPGVDIATVINLLGSRLGRIAVRAAIAQLVEAKIIDSVAGSLRMAIGDRESVRGAGK
jgi:hypothetical protein